MLVWAASRSSGGVSAIKSATFTPGSGRNVCEPAPNDTRAPADVACDGSLGEASSDVSGRISCGARIVKRSPLSTGVEVFAFHCKANAAIAIVAMIDTFESSAISSKPITAANASA